MKAARSTGDGFHGGTENRAFAPGTSAPSSEPPRAERELLERARQGDREAFRALVERHQHEVYYLALGLLRDRDDAEDVAQEVFLRAYRSLSRFRGDSELGTWLYRVTLNACRDHQRKGRFMKLQQSLGWIDDPESRWVEERPGADPERVVGSGRLRRDLSRALGCLTPAERETFVLRQLQQLSIRQTAEVTGRAEGTVKNLLFRALRRLRSELGAYRPIASAEDSP
ncbi:MAG: RNA polymerase sigma factor [Holophagales bacterium]|nr:RNA polymerase sigma factor [Holophagales bacterium]